MKCPHCSEGIHDAPRESPPFNTKGRIWYAYGQDCPQCKRPIIDLLAYTGTNLSNVGPISVHKFRAYPLHAPSRPVPAEVPEPYRQDFEEAVSVLPLSAKASAALSRRNLQAILRDKASTKARDLNDQIDEVINDNRLPSYITESLHAVRNIGNFGAHPIKSKSSGEIVPVEPGEAEWNLDVLESLFDFYFVQPALTAKRKSELNKKLRDAGKPELA